MNCHNLLRPALAAALVTCLGVSECPGTPEIDCETEPDNPACMEEDSCASDCQAHSQEVLFQCLAEGGRLPACEQEAQMDLELCLDEQCLEAPEPTPLPLPCDERCPKEGEEALATCLADGNPDEVCYGLQNEAESACFASCQAPVAATCADGCEAVAQEAFDACTAGGLPDMDCDAQYQASFESCVAACGPPPEEPESCSMTCESGAREVYDTCIQAGESEDVCTIQASEWQASCEAECAGEPVVSCDESCESEGRDWYMDCLASGGTEESCKSGALEIEQACHAACSGGEPTPEPTLEPEPTPTPLSCEETCALEVQEAVAQCVAEGGLEADCQADVGDPMLASCLEGCGSMPPEAPTCEDQCLDHSTQVFEDCLLAGGTDTECASEAGQDMDACLAACSGA